MAEIINGAVSEYELPREPKFYKNEDIGNIFIDKSSALRFPSGRSANRYVTRDDGIYEEWDSLDQYGKILPVGGSRLILPKEAFVAAYNAYIKED